MIRSKEELHCYIGGSIKFHHEGGGGGGWGSTYFAEDRMDLPRKAIVGPKGC